jgi:hypothetical protein
MIWRAEENAVSKTVAKQHKGCVLPVATGLRNIYALLWRGSNPARRFGLSAPGKSTILYGAVVPVPAFRPNKVGIALAVLDAAGILLLRDISRVERSARRFSAAKMVLHRLDDILVAYHDSLMTSCGYAPGAAPLLQESVGSIQWAVPDVRRGTIQNPDQQQRLRLLDAALGQVNPLDQRRLEVVERKGVDAGYAFYREGHGVQLDDRRKLGEGSRFFFTVPAARVGGLGSEQGSLSTA